MGRLITLEELEAYRQEVLHAAREDRVPRYRDPREVFNEDPNREDGFLVELSEDELNTLMDERQKRLDEQEQIKEQVIQEIMDNGNVIHSDQVLPISATQDERASASPDVPELTRDQAEALYNAGDGAEPISSGTLDNPSVAPSVAPQESVVPTPGNIEGAPEPMQSIVEAAALQGNDTPSPHQNLQSTPNPEPPGGTPAADNTADETGGVNATGGPDSGSTNPTLDSSWGTEGAPVINESTGGTNVPEPDLPDVHLPTELGEGEPTSVPSPTTDEQTAAQGAPEAPQEVPTQFSADTQQFQPVSGSNAGPTVPGAETVQTPTLNDEATVPSQPTTGETTPIMAADPTNPADVPTTNVSGDVSGEPSSTPENLDPNPPVNEPDPTDNNTENPPTNA